MKILIIEDDVVTSNIYRNKFLVEGYEVEIAHDGKAGFELVGTFRPDLILLDLVLPKISGIELLKKIRAQPAFEKTPVVVFTNTYLINSMQEAWKSGATKCLTKASCTPKQVLDIVRGVMEESAPGAKTPSPAVTASEPPPIRSASLSDPGTSADPDEEFRSELRRAFIENLPGTLAGLRTHLQVLIKAENEAARLGPLHELYRQIHTITGNAGIVGLLRIARMAEATEALLRELHEKPETVNASTLRTVAAAIDLLGVLFERDRLQSKQVMPPGNVLVVDDEVISRRAVTYALDKAKLTSVNVEDPAAAYKLLAEGTFDLIFLDVHMPGMNGFELCAKLRMLPGHKKTPVVFVTGLNDFESRASSTASGGNDFIAKPFLFIELAVKALTHVLRGRIESARQAGIGG